MYQKKYNLFLIKQTKKKYQNLQDAVNTVVKREIVVINTFSEKQKRSQVNSLN